MQNDTTLTNAAFNTTKELLGKENVEEMTIRMTAEDFSYYSQKVPACFFRLGVRNESKGIIHGVHNPKFNIDNEALNVGVSSLTAIALETLKNK